MKKALLLFFGYCTLASLFLFVGGVASFSQNGNVLPPLLLLPVAGYFLYHTGRALFKKGPLPSGTLSNRSLMITCIIFIALISGSMYSIRSREFSAKSKAKQQWTPGAAVTISPSPTPAMKYVRITVDGDDPVRVRLERNTTSEIVGKVRHDETYPVLEAEDGWTNIELSATESGWIKSEFAVYTEE